MLTSRRYWFICGQMKRVCSDVSSYEEYAQWWISAWREAGGVMERNVDDDFNITKQSVVCHTADLVRRPRNRNDCEQVKVQLGGKVCDCDRMN